MLGAITPRRIGAALAALVALLGSACAKSRGGVVFTNAPVVLISIDTLRADHLPAYGYASVATPAIDALRRDSILYADAYSHCPLTLPSHVSILSGLLPPEHGVRDNLGYNFAAKSHATLPGLLKARGYATGAAVSAYVLRGATGISDSFDLYEDAIEVPADSDAASQVRRTGDETARLALRWLDSVKARPFLLFFHIYEPHSPYRPPEPFKSRYASAYDGSIAAADAIVGGFLAELKRRGLYDRSIVVLLSDHGEGLGDHGEDYHGILLYREALRVPLLLKLPGEARGGESLRDPVGLVDVLPTVLGLLGIPAPKGLSGRSLLDPPRGGSRRGIYAETYYPRIHLGWSDLRSLVDDRYHFIDAPEPELYDLQRDPQEKNNIMGASAARGRSMKDAIARSARPFEAPSAVDPEDLEKLKALGYLSGVTATAAAGPRPNPRDEIHVLSDIRAAFALTAAGKDGEAVLALRKLLAQNPQLFDVEYELGRTLARLGRWQEAARVFREALGHAPSYAGPIALALARVTLQLGRLDEAAANASLAMELSPGQAHEILARVALARDDLATAESEAARAKGDGLAELNAALIEAEVRIRRSELREALTILDAARRRIAEEKLPPLRDLEFLRGDVLARLGRNAEAESAFKEEIRAFPANAQAYARLAIVYGIEGRSVALVHQLLEAMFQASATPETAVLAAKTLESMGDRSTAALWRLRARGGNSGG